MNYTPLGIQTEYSLLQSLIRIPDLIDFALKNNLKVLTITDNNLCGAMEFYKACESNNIKSIIGLNLKYKNKDILLYAQNEEGYHHLLKLYSISNEKELELSDLNLYKDNLICVLPFISKDLEQELSFDNIYIGFNTLDEQNCLSDNRIYLNEINYLDKNDKIYLKYIKAIKDNLLIDQIKEDQNDNHFFLENELSFDLTNNYKMFDLCNIKLTFKKSRIPKFPCPKGYDSFSYLKYLCKEGLKKKFGQQVGIKYIERLKHELDVINEMDFCDYFLIVWDYVKYAKENGILVGPGRGSSAGSLVSYCLNIIEIDPLKYQLLFERFLNKERITLPDIDIDFDGLRKEEVIEYCKEKYGVKSVANIITFNSLTSKQVIRDVGRVLDYPLELVDYFARMFSSNETLMNNYNNSQRIRNHLSKNPELKELFNIALKLENLKKHTSLHASGIVFCDTDLDDVIPLEKYKEDYLTGYQADYLEELGLIKMDFLSLKTLTTIDSMLNDNIDIDYLNIPLNDEKTLQMFKEGKTLGIFQFESPGMVQLLKKIKPRNFEEIYHINALYRPGPMINIEPFIRRRNGKEKIDYFDPSLEPILKSTYGIIIYQEQIMQIANIMANYSLGEADLLRRAMSKKKEKVMLNEREKFVNRSIQNGYSKEVAENVYQKILKFAEYGFAKAHAVAYSVIAYRMAYIKANEPLCFFKNMLNNVIGSSKDTKEFINEAKSLNISILNPTINESSLYYEIKNNSLLFPLSCIKNVGMTVTNNIIISRGNDKFQDIFDFIKRVDTKVVDRKAMESLIFTGCFDEFGLTRKTLYENLDTIINYADLVSDLSEEFVEVPELMIKDEYTERELIHFEYQSLGFYLNIHPVNEYRKKYNKPIHLNNIGNYRNRNIQIIARIDELKEIKNKNNERICFMKISDEMTVIDSPIFSDVYKETPKLNVGDIILISGKANRRNNKDQFISNQIKIIDKVIDN